MIDREQAWQILCEFTKSEGLRKHALAVETCVTAYARKYGEDEAKWSVTALLHDFDWEIHPTLPDHPTKGEPILAERGVSESKGGADQNPMSEEDFRANVKKIEDFIRLAGSRDSELKQKESEVLATLHAIHREYLDTWRDLWDARTRRPGES